MTTNNFDHTQLSTMSQRVAAWCDWNDLPMPELKSDVEDIFVTHEFGKWIWSSNICIEWLILGDPKAFGVA